MKSSKIWKFIWVSGIYVILFIILYLVVLYKVQWEYKDLNTYLYFYDCNRNVCTSTTYQSDYYSKMLCEDDICPYIIDIIGNNLILERENAQWIYNYINDEVIDNKYLEYRYIGNDNFIVTNASGMEGVIDLTGNLLVDFKYDYIDNYIDNFVSYRNGNMYGVDTIDAKYQINAEYEDIVLINDKLFAGMKDNLYYIYNYEKVSTQSNISYDYVYAYKDVILVIGNKKIDILNTNLDSTLLMKINTFYEYKTEKERGSLGIYFENNNIFFKVFTSETNYTQYVYNVDDKKIID